MIPLRLVWLASAFSYSTPTFFQPVICQFSSTKGDLRVHRCVLVRLVICIESTLIMGDKMAESVKPCQNVVRPILKRDVWGIRPYMQHPRHKTYRPQKPCITRKKRTWKWEVSETARTVFRIHLCLLKVETSKMWVVTQVLELNCYWYM
jgi:hypothetical protein